MEMGSTVASLLRQAGEPLTLERPATDGTYNTTTGKVEGASAPQTWSVYGIVSQPRDKDIIFDGVEAGDEFISISARVLELWDAIDVRLGDHIIGADGRIRRVVNVQRKKHGTTNYMFVVHARGLTS
jgi:hypothetical protein